jgi:hypothetical protein
LHTDKKPSENAEKKEQKETATIDSTVLKCNYGAWGCSCSDEVNDFFVDSADGYTATPGRLSRQQRAHIHREASYREQYLITKLTPSPISSAS